VEAVMTDNGSCYRSTVHAVACRGLGLRHLKTKPYRPQTNGKAERIIRTMLSGWAYAALYRDAADRTAALSAWLSYYSFDRRHGFPRAQAARCSLSGAEQPGWVLQLVLRPR
jgi:transposase InsO family protein